MNTDPTVLLGPQGQELLTRLAAEPDGAGTALALAVRLRREYPADLVAAATAQHELRLAARVKFSRAMQMLFTRAGYEQSSSEPIARYRAERFGGARRVADLCCGIGGDLLALAAGREALAVDRDDVHARLALHNAAVYGQTGNVSAVVADVRDIRLDGFDAVFIDPARRSGPGTASARRAPARPARRQLGPAGRHLTGRCLTGRRPPVPGRPVRAAARLVLRARRPGARRLRQGRPRPARWPIPVGWEAEFIADGRDLKEAVLWSPALATAPVAAAGGPRRATVMAGSGSHTLVACPGDPVPVTEPGEYLLDPNPAVTGPAWSRTSPARSAGRRQRRPRRDGDVSKIDPRIAFLTLNRPAQTPFARTLRVLDSAPWNEKRFAKRLRELGIGAADIRRRGLAGDVDQIHRRLKLAGPTARTIVITRVNDKPWGLICAP